jgi:hypothetical protein
MHPYTFHAMSKPAVPPPNALQWARAPKQLLLSAYFDSGVAAQDTTGASHPVCMCQACSVLPSAPGAVMPRALAAGLGRHTVWEGFILCISQYHRSYHGRYHRAVSQDSVVNTEANTVRGLSPMALTQVMHRARGRTAWATGRRCAHLQAVGIRMAG